MGRDSGLLNLAPKEHPMFRNSGRAASAAAGRVAEADVAAAARLAAAFQAVAARLEHFAALCVAARAGNAAAVLRVLALAVPTAEREVANLDAVPGAATRARAVAQGLTKVLQRGGGDLIVAVALDAEPTLALLELELTPRH